MYCSYLSNVNKKVLKAAIKFSILLDQQLNNIHHFINKIHRFSLIFGFSLVGLKFFSSCFKEVIWQVAYIERFWCFFIMSFLLYFNFFTFLISFYQFFHFLFFSNCSRLAKTILQLSIQILRITTYFFKKENCKVNLSNIAIIEYNYL